jgi:predicted Zn-dependent peptidase
MPAMTPHFRAIAFCLCTCFLFSQSHPLKGQKTLDSEQQSVFSFDTISSETLDNGLTLSFIQNSEFKDDALALHWEYTPGVAQNLAGLRSAHMRCLLETLKNQITAYPALDWATLEVSADGDLLTLLPTSEDFPEVLEWLANTITSFELEAATWSEVATAMKNELQERGAFSGINPIDQLMKHRLFSNQHPYGERPSASSVNAIQLEDIKAFHRKYYLPNNCHLVFCTPSGIQNLQANATNFFKDWKARSVPAASLARPGVGRYNEVSWITSDNTEFLTFQVGHVMRLKPENDDEWILTSLANVIRERIQSVLESSAQIEVNFEYDKSMGQFIIRGSHIAGSRILVNIQEILNVLQLITEELPSEEELAEAHEQWIKEQHSHSMDATFVAQVAASGPSNERLKSEEQMRNSLSAVTPNDVRRVANNLLRPRSLQIVGTGPQKIGLAIGESIDGNGNIDEYTSAGVLIEPYSPVPGLTPDSIFDAFYAACGGKRAFEDLNTSRSVVRMDAEGETVFTVTTENQYGIRFASSFEDNGQVVMENIVTMEEGFKRQMGVNQAMSSREYRRLRPELYAARFLHLDELQGEAEVLGTFETNGTLQYVVRIQFANNAVETLFFDQTSSMLIKAIVERMGASGPNQTTSDFDEYKTYNGLTFPSRITQTTNGRSVELVTEEMRLNVRINSDIFERN